MSAMVLARKAERLPSRVTRRWRKASCSSSNSRMHEKISSTIWGSMIGRPSVTLCTCVGVHGALH